jgi:hypothetical protein
MDDKSFPRIGAKHLTPRVHAHTGPRWHLSYFGSLHWGVPPASIVCHRMPDGKAIAVCGAKDRDGADLDKSRLAPLRPSFEPIHHLARPASSARLVIPSSEATHAFTFASAVGMSEWRQMEYGPSKKASFNGFKSMSKAGRLLSRTGRTPRAHADGLTLPVVEDPRHLVLYALFGRNFALRNTQQPSLAVVVDVDKELGDEWDAHFLAYGFMGSPGETEERYGVRR